MDVQRVLRVALGALAVSGALGCQGAAPSPAPSSAATVPGQPAPAPAPERIRAIYSSPTGGHSMLWVTKEAGFFEQNNLDVSLDLVRGNQQVLATLMTGDIDLAQNTGTSVIDAALASQSLVALGAFTDRFTYKLMVDPSIRQVADLKGLGFASSSPGSTDEVAARKTFTALGVDPRDLDFLSFQDQNGRVAAMRQGVTKGTLVVPPNDAVLRKSGFAELLDTADLDLPYVGIAPSVRPEYLRDHRAALERYMRAMVQGIAYYKQNPEFAKRAVGTYMQLDDPEVLEAAAAYYIKVMPRVPYVPEAGVRAMIEDAAALDPAVRRIDPATLYDNSLVRKIEESGLIKELYPD
jgi:ABC-type nitrate/sulfonate/bicarbonate transport system substrate-binding protein